MGNPWSRPLFFPKMNFLIYLFTVSPGVSSGSRIAALFVLAGLLLLAFFAIPVIRRNTENKALKKTMARSRTGALSFSLGIFFLVWMRLEEVSILSMRLWIVLTLAGLIVWIVWKVVFYSTTKRRIAHAEARRAKKG